VRIKKAECNKMELSKKEMLQKEKKYREPRGWCTPHSTPVAIPQ